MALDFPSSPSSGDVFTVGDIKWIYDGTKWTISNHISIADLDDVIDTISPSSGQSLTWDGSQWTAQTISMTANEILTALKTVDGAGSGLDADTLDGYSSSTFIDNVIKDTTHNNASTGYQKFSTGLTIQWGYRTWSMNDETYYFPLAFSNACTYFSISRYSVNDNNNTQSIKVMNKSYVTNNLSWGGTGFWIAIGY